MGLNLSCRFGSWFRWKEATGSRSFGNENYFMMDPKTKSDFYCMAFHDTAEEPRVVMLQNGQQMNSAGFG
jgi:hypothetical protein